MQASPIEAGWLVGGTTRHSRMQFASDDDVLARASRENEGQGRRHRHRRYHHHPR